MLDTGLHLRRVLYGFQAAEVLPYELLLSENMIHFAPVHPERLQLADLRSRTTLELYPPKDDPLRARLIREHAKRMPSKDTCMKLNDPCSPELFNEEIGPVATDGKGSFAFLADQSADHAAQAETPPETLVAQTVLYLYRQQRGAWFYCEERVSDPERDALYNSLANNFAAVNARCSPNLQVMPDLSTATYNPFRKTNPDTPRGPR